MALRAFTFFLVVMGTQNPGICHFGHYKSSMERSIEKDIFKIFYRFFFFQFGGQSTLKTSPKKWI